MAVPKIRNPNSTDNTKYAVDVFLVTPSDSVDFASVTRAISFAAAGTLAVVTEDGSVVTIPDGALAAGIMHPIGAQRINSTNTTATGIVGYI